MNNVTTVGIDLAKNIFQVHGADKAGKKVYSKALKREALIPFLAQQKKCLIGIEACGGSHYWARRFQELGHEVKMMAPQFVKPYVKADKTDRNDAAGIAEAVTRPHMQGVPIKTVAQQELQMLHRIRALAIEERTALSNQIRGFLAEFGIVIAQGLSKIFLELPRILENKGEVLSMKSVKLFEDMYDRFKAVDKKIKTYDKEIQEEAKGDEQCQRLMEVPGIGPITSTAFVAAVGNAQTFKTGRQVSAWLGLVPKQHSSGGKVKMQGISKRGDGYVRKLLIHGARAVIRTLGEKTDGRSEWLRKLVARAGVNKAAVALANKNARILWAILHNNEPYRGSPQGAQSYGDILVVAS
jgi:transposase